MSKTKRNPGPINPNEVRRYQLARPWLRLDGKVGAQTWGQVLLEDHIAKEREEPEEYSLRDLLWAVGIAVVMTALVIWIF